MHMALKTHGWTRAEFDRLPDDGNRYELIHGELLVSPAPRPAHWALVHAFRQALEPFCTRHGIGAVSENCALAVDDSEVIPDVVVRQMPVPPPERWDDAPLPSLVVEVLSPTNRSVDLVRKRAFYMECGVPEYWVVDGDARTVLVITADGSRTESDVLRWSAAGATLELDLPQLFKQVLG